MPEHLLRNFITGKDAATGAALENVVTLIKQNPDKSRVLMEGYDLRTVLGRPVDLRRLLQAKISALNFESEPFFSVMQFLKS